MTDTANAQGNTHADASGREPGDAAELEQLAALVAQAEQWRDQDPDPKTSKLLDDQIDLSRKGDEQALSTLHSEFDERLAFGTAGLRGEMGPGPARMNRVLVSQAAAGLASYLVEHADDERPTLVIGYDGRHNSEIFARDTAELAQAAGVDALLLPRNLPTPVTAFVLRHLDASAAVMVTASHNPGADNGYKVYLGGIDAGSQIISPADQLIAAHIDQIAQDFTVDQLPRSQAYRVLSEDVIDAYVTETAAAVAQRAPQASADGLSFVYTAMHGVGWEVAARLFETLGIPAPATVTEQIEPDPEFPTVAFPNPEEPGALDLSFALARKTGADLIIANDPDADRLAVAIPDDAAKGGWRRLTGNEVGWLLGDLIASEHRPGTPGALAASLVSSPLLGRIAEHYGIEHVETLTGFKYVNRVPGLIFGYEEALGYLVDPELVHDKDGVSAAALFLLLAARLKSEGHTVAQALQRIAADYGSAASDQVAIRVADRSLIAQATAALRAEPLTTIAGLDVVAHDDLLHGIDGLPPADILRYSLADGSRVIVRPSGTEPKLKIYLDVSSSLPDPAAAAAENAAKLAELRDWWQKRLHLG